VPRQGLHLSSQVKRVVGGQAHSTRPGQPLTEAGLCTPLFILLPTCSPFTQCLQACACQHCSHCHFLSLNLTLRW
jgi:hypothetical protein